jgi:hypothetical protein
MMNEPPETILLVHKNEFKKINKKPKITKPTNNDFVIENDSVPVVPSYIQFKDRDYSMWTILAFFFFIAFLSIFYKKK